MTNNPIGRYEAIWISKTYNGGLRFCVKKGVYDCYGFDFSNYYGSLLASEELKIPVKEGKQMKIDKIPDEIMFGFYKVSINCKHPNFKKVFALSPDDVYTCYSLKFAIQLQKHFDIDIELNTEDEFNCYIYDNKDLIEGDDLFGYWHQTIVELKKLCPNNILTKILSSTLWGTLSKKNCVYKTQAEAKHLNYGSTSECDYLILERNYNKDDSIYYKFQDMKNPYKYNIRIKSHLTAMGRNKTASIALNNLDSVLYIHTDGIIFNKPFEEKIEHFIPETRRTGLLKLTPRTDS